MYVYYKNSLAKVKFLHAEIEDKFNSSKSFDSIYIEIFEIECAKLTCKTLKSFWKKENLSPELIKCTNIIQPISVKISFSENSN